MRAHAQLLTNAMRDAGTDALLLGRPGNARWVTGADTLWLSGTRGFAPTCVVLPGPEVHLLSTTDDGIPADVVPVDHLFPMSWNPANLMGSLAAIPGLRGARRIGVDSITPMMEQLLAATFPDAELLDGESLVRAARRVKSDGDLDALRDAHALAHECLQTTIEAITPGTHERELVGVFEEHMASHGVTTPAFEGMFVVADGSRRTLPTDRVIAAGDLVRLRGGVLRDGWEGWLSRTVVCDAEPSELQQRAFAAADAAIDAVLAATRPDSSVRFLRNASVGIAVDGVGMGHEELADGDRLEAGMVLAVEADVDDVLLSETVVVTDDGYKPLP